MSTSDLRAQLADLVVVLKANADQVQSRLTALQDVAAVAKQFKLNTDALDAVIDFEAKLPTEEWIARLERLQNRPIILTILARLL